MNSIVELAQKSRSVRRFDAVQRLGRDRIISLVEAARYAPTAANRQPLRFIPVADEVWMERLFPLLHWAMALPQWEGPKPEERPGGYVVIVGDSDIAPLSACEVDAGIAAQTIALAAASEGLGCCMLGAYKRQDVAALFHLPEKMVPVLILALGVPHENVRLEDAEPEGSLKYYRDAEDAHIVPKRTLESLLLDP